MSAASSAPSLSPPTPQQGRKHQKPYQPAPAAAGGSDSSVSASYSAMNCSQIISDSKERKAFFNECVRKEKNHAYLATELAKRTKIMTKVFALCARFSSDYVNLKDLPAEAFDIIFPKDGLQSCHWALMLDESNNFLRERLAHFDEWVGNHGLPANLAELRDHNIASIQASLASKPDANAAQIAALEQQLLEQQTIAGNAFAMNQRLLDLAARKSEEAAAAHAAFMAQNSATAGLLAAMIPLSAMGDDISECYYCQHGRCNKH